MITISDNAATDALLRIVDIGGLTSGVVVSTECGTVNPAGQDAGLPDAG
jgi:beta-lactamase class A